MWVLDADVDVESDIYNGRRGSGGVVAADGLGGRKDLSRGGESKLR